ncbi:GGDEF domain-containing protein [Nitrosomonas oligotropha]|uniref:GGDEF domain-containing protein n=1 Tax=Nitrosomonas oligotropha TaxID=42354 RepID=UPI001368DC9D|nr:GGDEF domain-containing protein [Nitrosomonas oligotropha]MXS82121.1 diguanylate cyclase [Nitrosomonas oligotropha]
MEKMHSLNAEDIDASLLHTSDQVSAEKLQSSLVELAILKQMLAAAQQQIEILNKINICQRKKLIRFAKKLAQAHHFGYYDELTRLPNRRLLLNRLQQAITQSDRQHKQIALLFIDLDKFKSINDSFGHATGDKLLQMFAERLVACIRYGDTACRYGGDEFLIMLPEMDSPENVAVVTEKIRTQLSVPYVIDGQVIVLSASIGTTIYPINGKNCSELINQADIAMYCAKVNVNRPADLPTIGNG